MKEPTALLFGVGVFHSFDGGGNVGFQTVVAHNVELGGSQHVGLEKIGLYFREILAHLVGNTEEDGIDQIFTP